MGLPVRYWVITILAAMLGGGLIGLAIPVLWISLPLSFAYGWTCGKLMIAYHLKQLRKENMNG